MSKLRQKSLFLAKFQKENFSVVHMHTFLEGKLIKH